LRGPDSCFAPRSSRAARLDSFDGRRELAVDDVGDEPLYLQRVAALDVGKPQLEVCVPGARRARRNPAEPRRYADSPRRRRRSWRWRTGRVAGTCARLRWSQPRTTDGTDFRLGAEGLACQLLDAKQVKALPDDPRPTDVTQCALPAPSTAARSRRASSPARSSPAEHLDRVPTSAGSRNGRGKSNER
jgi:hypothetical protein